MCWPLLLACALAAPPPEPEPDRTTVRGSPAYESPPHASLTRERLAETAGADLPAVLDGEPGLTVSRLGGLGAFSTLSIRGSTPEQVLLVLDGVPLNPADGAPVDLSTLPLGPLSAVHIHRGRTPWSLGTTGLGGALLLETRRPDTATHEARLTLGAFETAAIDAFVAVPFALGPSRTLGLSLALDAQHTASDFRFENDGGTAWTDADDHLDTRANAWSNRIGLLARAELDLGGTRLTLVDVFTLADRGLPSLGVTPTTASSLSLLRNLGALHLAASPGPLLLDAALHLTTTTTDLADPRSEIGLGRDATRTTSLVPGARVTLRLPLSPSLTTRLVPSLHLAWRHEASDATDRPPTDRHLLASAAELLFRHRLAPALVLELATGLRLETDLSATPLATYLESALTLPDLRLTLGARHTPRLPSLFELHGDTGYALGNPALRPESATSLELGARFTPPIARRRPLALSLFAYATWADDLIQFIQNAQGVQRPENLASARILGLELAAELTLGEHLRLRSNLTLTDAIDTSAIAARAGNHLPLTPTFATSHRLELRRPDATLGPLHGAAGLYLELDHVAGNHLDFANLVAVPPRTLLGAGAFVHADTVRVTLSLANLLSDRVQDLAGYPLPGLTTMLTLTLTPSSP